MRIAGFLLLLVIFPAFFGCRVVQDTPKYAFTDGYYSSKLFRQVHGKVYVEIGNDSITVYPVASKGGTILPDTSGNLFRSFLPENRPAAFGSQHFRQAGFDFDFLTIPFKFRPASTTMPPQFNTNLNGAVYIGYRNDIFLLRYKKTPLNRSRRQITHYGFSFGVINGLGGTAMNQWVTENHISSEYDGVVWSKGIAGIMGIDNFSIGLALGWDDLLDTNRKHWIYQQKPWLGLAFGLNLN